MRVVEVTGVFKAYGSVTALRDISFEIGAGEVVGLLGPNGAGKTTMVDILSTLTRPDQGTAIVAGHDVVGNAAGVREAIMLTGQQVAVDNLLTGKQNLVLFGRLQGLDKRAAMKRADELIGEFDLKDASDRRVRTYSGGMRRRIDIACGLVVTPQVAFLDEPTTGLDPRSRHSVWKLIHQLKESGIATLLTTQYLEEADELSDRIIVMNRGDVIAEGTPDDLKALAGGTVCEIVPENIADVPAAVAALAPLLREESATAQDATVDRVVLPAPDGAHTLMAALRRLDAAKIEVADAALRRPSLDDVFFALTAEQPGANAPP
jgi:ABC-2 type transport system ATP-binding protein